MFGFTETISNFYSDGKNTVRLHMPLEKEFLAHMGKKTRTCTGRKTAPLRQKRNRNLINLECAKFILRKL